MKMTSIVFILILTPLLVFAAPKKKVTIPDLKKQVTALIKERDDFKEQNKILKAQLDILKSSTAVSCTNERIIEYRNTVTPVVVSSGTNTQTQPQSQRQIKLNASAYQTGEEDADRMKIVKGVKFQITNVQPTDVISVENVEQIADMQSTQDSRMYTFSLSASKFKLIVNGKEYYPEIIVKNEIDRGNDYNKRVYLSPSLYFINV